MQRLWIARLDQMFFWSLILLGKPVADATEIQLISYMHSCHHNTLKG